MKLKLYIMFSVCSFLLASNSVFGQTTHFLYTSNTGNNAIIGIPTSINPTIGGVAIAVGDEIGVFTPAGLCVGAGVWTGSNIAITAWGDNAETTVIDGIVGGEQMQFRMWRKSTNTEYSAQVTYTQGNSTYAIDGIYQLGSLIATSQLLPVTNTTHGGSFTTIQAAINAAIGDNDIITVDGSTYAGGEAITVSKKVTIQGVTSTPTITPPAGAVGITVTTNGVTLDNLTVTGATGGLTKHGIWANGVSGLTIQNVSATNNGGSGIALRGVTGTSVLTNVTATNNKAHGLEIGNGSTNVQVNGGTFTGNGVAGNPSYGGGIMIYADAGKSTNGTSIFGSVNASTNTTAGIYLYCDSLGTINNTSINGSTTVSLNGNGSSGYGGAAVIVYGPCDNTHITATATKTVGFQVAGLVIVGTNSAGLHSPTNTVVKDCNLSGYDINSPAGTMTVTNGTQTLICTNDVDATVGNNISGFSSGFQVEDALMHKMDNSQLGLFKGPGTTLYVTPNSGSIQRAINIASTYSITQINVENGTYAENVNVITPLVINGQGAGTIITPTSGDGITVSSVDNVTIENLKVYHAPNHGIWARGAGGLTITNVVADSNGFCGKASGIALRADTNAILTNITAMNNTSHGLEIGRRSVGVQVIGGTFNNNGTTNDLSTGGGIMIYSDLIGSANPVQNTVIKGTLTASSNMTAGIYIYSSPGTVSGTSIGQTGGDAITLSNNGSTGTDGSGGAGVLVYGGATSTTMSALFTRSSVVGGGLVVLGTDNLGTSSPSGTIVKNSTFTGYNTTPSPAITLASETFSGSWTTNAKICTTGVTATTNVTFTGATTSTAIDALIYDQKDNATLGLVSYTSPSILVKVKVFLQGPFNAGSMNTTLYSLGDIPTAQPYTVSPFNYAGSESATTPAGVVDWILVELRAVFNGAAVDRRAAFLKSDGSVVDVDGSSNLAFNSASAGNYYIVIKHRNHLAVMSAAPVSLPNASVYDFTTAQTQAYGAAPMKALTGGVYGMYVGDFDNNNLINATDLSVSNGYLTQSGTSGYKQGDFDMNGLVNASDGPLAQPNSGVATAVPNP